MSSKTQATSPMERMIRTQIMERGINDANVIDAIRLTPRDRFFPEAGREEAYTDRAHPIGHGQTISQPYMVALMTQRLELLPTHRVLEIGTGSGYQTAILARLAKEVWSVERVKALLDTAFERIMDLNLRNVHFRHADGTLGWREAAPFDRILIAAGAPKIPEQLLREQLVDGGIAIVPVGDEEEQMLVSVKRDRDALIQTDICPCRFVKLVGSEGWQT